MSSTFKMMIVHLMVEGGPLTAAKIRLRRTAAKIRLQGTAAKIRPQGQVRGHRAKQVRGHRAKLRMAKKAAMAT